MRPKDKRTVIAAVFFMFFVCINISGLCLAQDAAKDKLSSELLQLADAERPLEYAQRHGIGLTGNSVKVVIVFNEKFNMGRIRARYGLKEVKKYGNSVEAAVPIKELITLCREENVKYVRRPYKFWKFRW